MGGPAHERFNAMNDFMFPTDDEGYAFCRKIVQQMVLLFGLDENEAIGRINREWMNVRLVGSEHVF